MGAACKESLCKRDKGALPWHPQPCAGAPSRGSPGLISASSGCPCGGPGQQLTGPGPAFLSGVLTRAERVADRPGL